MNILIVVDSDPLREQRVMNMVQLMSNFGTVTVMEIETSKSNRTSNETNSKFKKVTISRKNPKSHWKKGFFARKYRSLVNRILYFFYRKNHFIRELLTISALSAKKIQSHIDVSDYQITVIHHIWNIPSVYNAFRDTDTTFICNLHEYYPEQHAENDEWMQEQNGYLNYICRKYLKKMNTCFSVCDSISQRYLKNFGGNYILFRNIKEYFDLTPSTNDEKITHLVHHGIANRSRKIENFIQAVDMLGGRFQLHLFLTASSSDPDYHRSLEELANASAFAEFHAPVPTKEIPAHINKYDIALSIVPNANFNQLCMLPNKVFESIQARLMLIVGPSHEMKELVERHDIGISIPEASAECLARTLANLDTSTIAGFKQRSHLAAREVCTETEIKRAISELRKVGIVATG